MRMSCSGRLVLVLVFTAILTDVRFRFLVHQGLCGKQRDREAGVPASSDSVDVPIGRDGLRPPGKVNAPRPVGVAPIKSLADPSEVCIFLTGELFRSGRKGDRQKLSLDDDWVVSEQKRASQSQVENLLQPLQERLGAKLRLYLDTWDKSGEEEFAELVRSFYRPFEITKFVARKWVQEGKAVRDSVGGTRTPEAPENNKQSQSSSAPAESGGGSSSQEEATCLTDPGRRSDRQTRPGAVVPGPDAGFSQGLRGCGKLRRWAALVAAGYRLENRDAGHSPHGARRVVCEEHQRKFRSLNLHAIQPAALEFPRESNRSA